MRVIGPAGDDVGAGAGAGGDGDLGADVFPADEIGADLDAGGFDEFGGVFVPDDFVRVNELGRADDAERGAGLDRLLWRIDLGHRDGGMGGTRLEGGCRHRSTRADDETVTPGKFCHSLGLPRLRRVGRMLHSWDVALS